jgi:hypothetical protein
MEASEKLFINGIDAVTGQYLVPPLTMTEAVDLLKKAAEPPATISWLRRIWWTINQPHLGLPFDVDAASVAQAGWGAVFHCDTSPEVRAALNPLINHRRSQVGDEARFKVLEYRTGEERATWLARHGVGAGSVEPTKVPYYLLLVGSPEDIPFSFCHQLDVEYAVGWLHFDRAEEYASYAASVVRYETAAELPNAKEVVFFASRHDLDPATQLSADQLVNPLADGTQVGSTPSTGVAERQGFRRRKFWGDAATKSALTDVLRSEAGERPPAFLFTATHGMGFPRGHARQISAQGALLCQDWPGFGSISPDHYFAAVDLPADARVHGLIAFHFACFGGGTPARDRFVHKAGVPPPLIADRSFLAALPKALLSHPGGGALAVIAHVERAWGYSIVTPNAGPQLLPFENAIGRLLTGQPVGYALKDFNERYAALSTSLASMLEEVSFGAQVSDLDLVASWVARNDAEGYVVLGDPAVSLRHSDLT